ncbi:MAG TPA: hypothetical protein VHB02_04155 [Acidimicrobiales bacterium]|nr:hypothetical protein [Acidimicrobiales bacterium]
MIDVERVLRGQDPAAAVDLPTAESPMGRHVRALVRPPSGIGRPAYRRDRPFRRRPGGRLAAVAAMAAATAAAVGVAVAFLPGAGHPESAAATTFDRLADQAGRAVTTLAPGQYAYTETETTGQSVGVEVSAATGAVVYRYSFTTTVQTWVGADGSGRRVETTDPTPRFPTAADRAAWVAAGRPDLDQVPAVQHNPQVWRFGPGGRPVGASGGAAPATEPDPLYDATGLPTDPTALAQALASGKGIDPSLATAAGCAGGQLTTPCVSFQRAVALLEGPAVGSSPALRSALFHVLASLPGVRAVGTVTDPAGRKGTELELVTHPTIGPVVVQCPAPSGGGLFMVAEPFGNNGAATVDYRLVVDPRSTTVLAVWDGPVARGGVSLTTCSGQPAAVATTGTWTTVLSSGVVGSDHATPAHRVRSAGSRTTTV